MKDNQHEQLFTELTPEFEAPAFTELNDEVAATCSGGEGWTGGSTPDVILYDRSDFTGKKALRVNAKTNDGLWSLTGYGFNDITSSITILKGTWTFYGEAGYKGSEKTLGPGNYTVTESGITNDSLSSLKRIKA